DNSIVGSVALQPWERDRIPVLATREADAMLAKGAATPRHVLRVYEYERIPERGPHDMAIRQRDAMRQRTDNLRERRIDDYIAPLPEHTLAGRQPAGGYGADGSSRHGRGAAAGQPPHMGEHGWGPQWDGTAAHQEGALHRPEGVAQGRGGWGAG